MSTIIGPALTGFVDFGLGTEGAGPSGPGSWEDTVQGGPWVRVRGRDLVITWSAEAGPDAVFQVYLDRRLAWTGPGRRAVLPRTGSPVTVEVVTVSAGSGRVDFSGSFPPLPGRSCTIQWSGGRYLSPDLVAFRIYRSAAPGGPVVYSGAPLARVSAGPPGAMGDGFGIGGFGRGGFGYSEMRYTWTSGPMPAGLWTFGVVAEDSSGHLGPPAEATIPHGPPPEPPGQGPRGVRLNLTVDPGSRVPTLTWLPSPG